MKKVLCIFTALCLLCLGMTMAVFADGDALVSADDTVECLPGATNVPVVITMEENPGIAGFLVVIEFDKTKITPVSYEPNYDFYNEAAMGLSNLDNPNVVLENLDYVTFVFDSTSNVSSTGEVATFYFDVADGLPLGTQIPLTVTTEAGNNMDQNHQLVTMNVSDGLITVKGEIEYTFEDDEVVYDGTAQTIDVTDLPQGVNVSYTYEKLNEATSEYEEVGSCVDVGTYRVTANMTGAAYFPEEDTATLTITPATITGYTFEDAEVTFDGTAKTLDVTAAQDATAGVSIAYESDGAPFDGETMPGEYEVTATITKANYTPVELTATLTIVEAEIEGYTFADSTVTYDETLKNIEVTAAQNATEDVTIVYTSDGEPFEGATMPGEYEVTADITKLGYNPIQLTATLTIVEADIEGYSFDDSTVTYDETAKTIEVEAAQDATAGVSIAYTLGGEPFEGATMPGDYEVTATITKAGYNDLTLTATLTIEPADIEGYSFDDSTVTYDETAKTIEVEAAQDATAGVSIAYTLGGEPFVNATEPGEYEVTATITKAGYNDLTLTATLTIEEADIEGYTFDDDEVVYDTTSHTIAVTAANDATAGVNIVYTSNGEAFTGGVNAGTYPVTATITKAGYNDLVLNATLVITPAPGVQNPAYINSTTFPYTYAVATLSGDEVTGDIDLTGTGFAFVDDEAALAIGDNTVNVNYTSSDPNYYDVINAEKVVRLTSRNLLDVYDLRFEDDDAQWYSVDAYNVSEAKTMTGVKYYINDVEQDNLPAELTVVYSFDGESYDDELVVYEGGTYAAYAKISADGYDDLYLTASFKLNYLVGDVNTDNRVDLADAIKIMQDIARWFVGADDPFTITQRKAGSRVKEEYNALNNADVIMMLQKFAEWQGIEFGPAD